jgi:hypothetical protein
MAYLRVFVGSVLVAMTIAFAPSAWAQGPMDETTRVTFSSPVELPGIALPAGTYIFRLPDREGARHVLQVLSADRSTVYAMLQGVERTRTEPSDTGIATFNEGASTAPPAIRTWFFADDPVGLEFIYPKDQAERIAHRAHQQVLTEDRTDTQ